MTPLIALDLSLDGIVVMSRAPAGPDRGKWWREGVVRLDDEDLADQLRRMRARCAARVGEDFTSILVIPDSQLLFTSLERDDRSARTTIRALLKGRTPYPVEDLAFDFVERGDRLQVAVVARDTLLEAEAFAAGFGFRPVALVGNPKDSPYPGLPDFGPTSAAADLLGGEPLSLELDDGFTVVPAPAPPGAAEPAPQARDASTEPFRRAAAEPETRAASPEIRSTEPDPANVLPDLTAPRVPAAPPLPPKPVTSPGTPLPAQAGRPRLGPGAPPAEAGDDPSGFAAVMATMPGPPPPETDASSDGSEIERDAPTAVDGAAPSGAPAFSTRRRASAGEATRVELGLDRITPRLSRPAADQGALAAAAGTAPTRAVSSEAAVEPHDQHVVAPQSATTASSDGSAGTSLRSAVLSALTGAMSRAAAGIDRSGMLPRGLRERLRKRSPSVAGRGEVAPTRRAAGGRLGLYITLSLLVLLGLLAAWAVAFRGDDVASRAASDDAPAAIDAAPASSGDGSGPDISIADTASSDDIAAPAPAGPSGDDLALLLPDSRGTSAAADLPTELDAPRDAGIDSAMGADALEAGPVEDGPTTAEIGPEIAVVTIDAEPFELPRDIADAPETGSSEEIYVASIDPVIAGSDAVALPRAEPPVDSFSPQTSPAPAGTDFDTGSDGLVVASASGTLAPGGYSVIAGRPATLPAPRPDGTAAQEATRGADQDTARIELGRLRPTPRPDDAPERAERLTYNGLTREELTRTPPVPRPAAIAEAVSRAEAAATRQAAAVQAAASAAVASLAQTEAPLDVPEPDVADAVSQSRYALAESRRPPERPRSVEQDAARIVTQRRERPAAASAFASAAAAPAPAAASAEGNRQTLRSAGGSVSRAATQSSQIRLREMNLIGVYGRPNARRALVRLSNGRYVKIEVGDRLERGRVTAIGESEVIYQQNGRNYALRMPQT